MLDLGHVKSSPQLVPQVCFPQQCTSCTLTCTQEFLSTCNISKENWKVAYGTLSCILLCQVLNCVSMVGRDEVESNRNWNKFVGSVSKLHVMSTSNYPVPMVMFILTSSHLHPKGNLWFWLTFLPLSKASGPHTVMCRNFFGSLNHHYRHCYFFLNLQF